MRVTKYYTYFKLDDKNFLLINTLTCALDVVEKNVIDILNSYNINDNFSIDEDLKQSLIQRGYLITDDEDIKLLNKLTKLMLSKGNQGNFIICPTYLCNLRCPYCFEDVSTRLESKVLNRTDIDKIFECINTIKEQRNFEDISISLYGGEPFLPSTYDAVSYIFEKTVSSNYKIKAISNGTNLEQFKNLFENHIKYIDQIQITLDGPEHIHNKTRVRIDKSGTFDSVVNNVDMLLKIDIPVVLRVNTGSNNIDFLPEIVHLINNKSWNSYNKFICQLAPINDHYCSNTVPGWLPEDELLEKIYNSLGNYEKLRTDSKIVLGSEIEKKISLIRSIWDKKCSNKPALSPCGAASRSYYVFGADGYIYACPETVGKRELSIGTFLPEFNIDQTKEAIWSRDVTNIEKCTDCNIVGLCGTSCMWTSIATNGNNFSEPICNRAKELLEKFVELSRDIILTSVGVCNEYTNS